MRILNFESPLLAAAFTRLGHEVISVGTSPTCHICVDGSRFALNVYRHCAEQGFTPDMAFFCDAGNLPCFPGMEALPCPTIFYSIDTYCHTWHFSYAHGFDLIFAAQWEHVPLFAAEGHRALWLPLFAREGVDICRHEERDLPVAFVGTLTPKNIPDRKPFLEAFHREHPLFMGSGAYVDVFNRARIVLNQTAASEVNFRCFEAMACGAALLTEHSPHALEKLFIPGEHVLPLYQRGNVCEAATVARAAFAHPQALAALAQKGCDHVHAHHLDTHRASQIMRSLEAILPCVPHRQRLADLPRRRKFLAMAYGMIADGLTDPALLSHALYFEHLAAQNMEAKAVYKMPGKTSGKTPGSLV